MRIYLHENYFSISIFPSISFNWPIKTLEGDADGAPKDGKVAIYELNSYLDDQVPEMTRKLKGKPQYPYTFSRGQDFPVVIKK